MLWFIFIVLLFMWLLGFITGNVLGGFLHILLIIAVVVVLIRIIQGRRPL
ncbi:lmo0937 family membrane protein [Halalkalibacter akibai]|nr:lmo0937 family membrane protein [Halalkalibacter akibai]